MRFQVVCVSLLVAACASEPTPAGDPTVSHVEIHDWEVWFRSRFDVLFVVDRTTAMEPHREAIAANAAGFVERLRNERFPRDRPFDLHVGFVSSDLGTRGPRDVGVTPAAAGCTPAGDGGYLYLPGEERGWFLSEETLHDGTIARSYAGELADIIGAALHPGPTGCGFSRPLEAMRRALTNPTNDGFRRETAQLVVVFLTSRDDCSFPRASFLDGADPFDCVARADELVSVGEYADFLRALPASRLHVRGIFGPPTPFVVDEQARRVEPSCTNGARSAEPGVRLAAFLDLFRDHTVLAPLCDDDLSPALGLTDGDFIPLGARCLELPPRDRDPVTPGLQPDCTAALRAELATGIDERALPTCDGANAPCWTIGAGIGCGYEGAATNLGPLFERVIAGADATRTTVHAECVVDDVP